MYVYIKSEPQLYTVGFYDPKGQWHPESDHPVKKEAEQHVAYLNGGKTDEQSIEDRGTLYPAIGEIDANGKKVTVGVLCMTFPGAKGKDANTGYHYNIEPIIPFSGVQIYCKETERTYVLSSKEMLDMAIEKGIDKKEPILNPLKKRKSKIKRR